MPPNDAGDRFVGITVLPEYIQSEGIDALLDNLRRKAKATAVATSPYVMEPADEKTGSREPPIDAGAGKVRLLDRPLFGKRELFVRTAPSFESDPGLYRGLPYQPSPATELTKKQGGLIGQFIRQAHGAGLKVYFQVQAAIPPGYRVQFGGPREKDRATLPDGRIPPRRLANNGSLASAAIRGYTEALLKDLAKTYPEVDGFRVDWPEYPPYFLDDAFLDFSEHARAAAQRLGFDFETMRRAAGNLYSLLHGGLTDRHLRQWVEADGGRYGLLETLIGEAALLDWLRFKSALVAELLQGFRRALNEAGASDKPLVPNAFPPPFTLASGMDFGRIAPHCAAVSVKLYTMHWPMILRFYGESLQKANPGLHETWLVRALVRLLDIADGEGLHHLNDYTYPEPDAPHPVGLDAQRRKIAQARAAAGALPVYALAHGYGPEDDFRRRLEAAYHAAGRKVWINRYGYLSDRKLEIIGEVCN